MKNFANKKLANFNTDKLGNMSLNDVSGIFSIDHLSAPEPISYSAEHQDSYSISTWRPVFSIHHDTTNAYYERDYIDVVVHKGVKVTEYRSKAAITVKGRDCQLRIEDGAEIESDAAGARMRKDDCYVVNFGKVKATKDALDMKAANNAIIFNYGDLESTEKKGIDLKYSEGSKLYNDGRIHAWTEGVEMGDGGYIHNSGRILSEKDDAINMSENAEIYNFGTILTDEGDAIDVDSGKIFNGDYALIETQDGSQGAIDIDAGNASLTVTNYGNIRGGYGIKTDDGTKGDMDMQAQIIDNHGRITGFRHEAITVNGGNDVVKLHMGSNVTGDIDMGIGNDVVQITSSRQIINGKIHGGHGFDTLSFKSGLSYNDIEHVTFGQNALHTGEAYIILSKTHSDGSTYAVTTHVDGFEFLVFDDRTMSFSEFYNRKAPRPNGYQAEEQVTYAAEPTFEEPVIEEYSDWGYL